MRFYTNCFQRGNTIFVRGIENGKRFSRKEYYKPYLFVSSPEASTYRTIHGEPVEKIDFDSIKDAREFLEKYSDVSNFPIYGQTSWAYNYIFDSFQGPIDYDPTKISVCSLDIETRIGDTDVATSLQTTPNEITAITISRRGKMTTLGCGEFQSNDPNINYIKCRDEIHLLRRFIEVWEAYDPDVITGWNIEFFDIPYLVGRIIRLLGEDAANKMSPWGMIRPYEVEIKGKNITSYELRGITVLDYMALYKKFTYTNQESYRLDHIAFVELSEKKIDYRDEGYANLNDLYDRNFQLFIDYNIKDVRLVDMLEDKMKLIELVFTLAYLAKVNYSDTLSTVRIWEVIIHNYLMEQNKVVPQKKHNSMTDFVGGYVKEVQTGMHRWVMSLDLDSLYPHLIMQYNISPETFVKRLPSFYSMDQLLDRNFHLDILDPQYSYAANGCVYRKDEQGFLAALMENLYESRSKYKRQMIENEKLLEQIKSEMKKRSMSDLG